jgi:hypothetical protein
MNIYLISAAVLLSLLMSITAVTNIKAQPATLNKIYTNAECGISINYPSDWTPEQVDQKSDETPRTLVMFFNDESSDSIDIGVGAMSDFLGSSYEQSMDGLVEFSRVY